MKYILIILSIIAVLIFILAFFVKGSDRQESLAALSAEEHKALMDVLEQTGKSITQIKSLTPFGFTLDSVDNAFSVYQSHVVELKLSQTQGLNSFESLRALRGLRWLGLDGGNVKSFLPLSDLTQLETLVLKNIRIESWQGLNVLTNLKKLIITGCQLQDLNELKTLHKLASLDLSQNQIRDLTPITLLTQLKTLNITGNPDLVWPMQYPTSWEVDADVLPPHLKPQYRDNWVSYKQVKDDGKYEKYGREGLVAQGSSWTVKAHMGKIIGTVKVWGIPGHNNVGGHVQILTSVKKGTIRVYLKDYIKDPKAFLGRQWGYTWTEVSAGNPVLIKGDLTYINRQYELEHAYEFIVQSMTPESEDIDFVITRQPKS